MVTPGKILVSTPVYVLFSTIVDVNSWRSVVYVILIHWENGEIEKTTFVAEWGD
jgi:hypothetical protein